VPLDDTIAGCEAILAGQFDGREENALYMIGAIGEAKS
jgi:F-type H+-transporting ATPase subunit beta